MKKQYFTIWLVAVILLVGFSVKSFASDEGNYTKKMITSSLSKGDCDKIGPDSIKTIQNYSLYREFFKQKNYDEAMKYWRYIYKNAPGIRRQVYTDGEKYFVSQIKDNKGEVKDAYVDSLMALYDQRIKCYGNEGYVLGKKGYDLLKYRSSAKEEIKNLLAKSIEIEKNKTPFHILVPYFKLVLIDVSAKKVTPEEALSIKEEIFAIADANNEHPKYADRYAKVKTDIDKLFSENDVVGRLFDCNAMMDTYKEQYATSSNDVNTVKTLLSKMSGCKSDPFYDELYVKLAHLEPTADRILMLASREMKAGNHDAALPMIQQAINMETDVVEKAKLNYKLAEIHYSKKDFQTARSFAKEAIAQNPNSGMPYILIGKLYASSGKLCGPGTGFESQKVIWPALDYFYKAKKMDPSVEEEANRLIGKYSYYLPEKSELFMMGYKQGDPFKVGCWIQENTTVKTK